MNQGVTSNFNPGLKNGDLQSISVQSFAPKTHVVNLKLEDLVGDQPLKSK